MPHAVLDGEVVALDAEGRPSFQRLQQRVHLTRADEIARGAIENPVTYQVFDLLGFGEHDLRDLELATRKQLLARLVPPVGPLRYAEHFEERGEEVYAQVEALGLEGIVGKRADSRYRSGRSPFWKKVRSLETADLVVVGFTAPAGSRSGFGALHLARAEGEEFVYAGRVGTGFSDKLLVTLRAELEKIRRATPPCRDAPRARGPLGGAEARLRGPLHRDHRRRPAAPAGLRAPARRQERRPSARSRCPRRRRPRRPRSP